MFKDYKERKPAMLQNTCEINRKRVGFTLFLPSFINVFVYSNPRERKTQIRTKSLNRTSFLTLRVLLKSLCSELYECVEPESQTRCSSSH